ncbi:hypothetical protein [Noviherbaspirillum sp.]|uniref:hypothetical protein n=1 Tax=Noviherbaspirillum sp. TaxID=1926288 RepID=UPI002FE13A2C
MRERPVSCVPKAALALLGTGLALQIGWHVAMPEPQAAAQALPQPPTATTLRLASVGEPIGLGKLLMLYIQAFDNQPGISLPFRQLDYAVLETWLERVVDLDPRGQYPLLAASRLYAEVADDARKRRMLEFVHRRFAEDPDRRWPALAHATIVAKHQLKDLPLALRYARAIREKATGGNVPNWARQMEIFILEDMNEIDSAKILIGGLLQSGQITDPHELRFLDERLKAMRKKPTEQAAPR